MWLSFDLVFASQKGIAAQLTFVELARRWRSRRGINQTEGTGSPWLAESVIFVMIFQDDSPGPAAATQSKAPLSSASCLHCRAMHLTALCITSHACSTVHHKPDRYPSLPSTRCIHWLYTSAIPVKAYSLVWHSSQVLDFVGCLSGITQKSTLCVKHTCAKTFWSWNITKTQTVQNDSSLRKCSHPLLCQTYSHRSLLLIKALKKILNFLSSNNVFKAKISRV